jgi:DNA polymerase-3 subunit gamma/tau
MAQMRRAADLREVLQKIDRLEQMAENGEIPDSLGGTPPASSPADPEGDTSEAGSASQPSTPEAAEPTPSYATDAADDDAQHTSSPTDGETDTDASGAPAPEPSPAPDDADTENEDEESGDEFTAPDDADEASDEAPGDAPPLDDDPDDASVEYGDLFGSPALDDGGSAGDGASGSPSSDDGSSNGSSTDAQGSRSSSDDTGGPQAAVAEPAVEPAVPGADVDGLAKRWPQFVRAVKGDRISLGSLLGETEPVELRNEVLTVAVPKSLHRETLRDQRRLLLEHLSATFDVAIDDVEFIVEQPSAAEADDGTNDAEPKSPREQLQDLRDTYASLDVLFNEFGAEPVW